MDKAQEQFERLAVAVGSIASGVTCLEWEICRGDAIPYIDPPPPIPVSDRDRNESLIGYAHELAAHLDAVVQILRSRKAAA